MLTITVGGSEHIKEHPNGEVEFLIVGGDKIQLEHSLASLSKWESIHHVPFLGEQEKTLEQTLSYIECMVVDEEVPPDFLEKLTEKNVDEINAYINDQSTATWFNETPGPKKRSGETFTNELIHHWMIEFGIPLECEHWHLERLFTLIKVRQVKLSKPEKQNAGEAAAARAALNEKRKREWGTSG